MGYEAIKTIPGTMIKASLEEPRLCESPSLRGRVIYLNVDRLYGWSDPYALKSHDIVVIDTFFLNTY